MLVKRSAPDVHAVAYNLDRDVTAQKICDCTSTDGARGNGTRTPHTPLSLTARTLVAPIARGGHLGGDSPEREFGEAAVFGRE